MRICDLQDGQLGYGEGRFYFCTGHASYQDEFRQRIYPKSYFSPCKLAERRVVAENTAYRCRTKWLECPTYPVIFTDADGYRHRIEMQNYRLQVWFAFKTTDARSPSGTAVFTSSSGRFAKMLLESDWFSFHIDEAGNVTCRINGRIVVASGQ
jgi:hypothetical protein